jgi:hypothetical protein
VLAGYDEKIPVEDKALRAQIELAKEFITMRSETFPES